MHQYAPGATLASGAGRLGPEMAPLVLTQDEAAAAMLLGSSELKFLLGKEQVSESTQAKLFHSGITTIPMLGTIAENLTDFKAMIRTEFGIDPSASMPMRIETARMVLVYNSAMVRTEKKVEMDGELEARHLPKQLSKTEFTSMKEAWENKYWALEDNETPARSYMEKRGDELGQGDFRAEMLKTVVHRDEEDPDNLVPVFDFLGTVKLRRAASTTSDPNNPEQLRKRICLMGTGLMMLGMRHTNRKELQGLSPQVFQAYLNYLLGDYVWMLVAKDPEGHTVSCPSWLQLLSYEYQIRKKTYAMMQAGKGSFAECLPAAWNDPIVKERFFTTPLAYAAAATGIHSQGNAFAQAGLVADAEAAATPPGKGRGKKKLKLKQLGLKQEKGKGKGKGKGTRPRGRCQAQTPAGEPICFGYNDAEKKCANRICPFKHVCGICFQKHPLYACGGNGDAAPGGETRES